MNLRSRKLRTFLVSATITLLTVGVSVAMAAIIFNANGITSDSNITIDGARTIYIGNASATAVTIGRTGEPVTFPGSLSVSGTITFADGTTQSSAAAPAHTIDVTAAPYYASGSATTTTVSGSLSSGTTTVVVADGSSFSANEGIYIAGAGTSGANYIGTVTAVNGNTLTVSPAVSTGVSNGTAVQHDETNAIQSAVNALSVTGGAIIFPSGVYNVNGPLQANAAATARSSNSRRSTAARAAFS